MPAGAGVAGGVHRHRTGADEIAAEHSTERRRSRSERGAVDRRAGRKRAGQRQLPDRVVARHTGKGVIAGIGPREAAHALDAGVAAGVEVPAGAGVAGGVHRHRGAQLVRSNQIGEGHGTGLKRRAIDRRTGCKRAGQRQRVNRQRAVSVTNDVSALVGVQPTWCDDVAADIGRGLCSAAVAHCAEQVSAGRDRIAHAKCRGGLTVRPDDVVRCHRQRGHETAQKRIGESVIHHPRVDEVPRRVVRAVGCSRRNKIGLRHHLGGGHANATAS